MVGGFLMEKDKENSSFNLLKIISMIFIVIYHTILYGQVFTNTKNPGISLIFLIIKMFLIIHVNLFVMITGYFQCEKKFKQSKIWSIISSSLFYKIVIMILFSFLGYISLSNLDILEELFPLEINQYWFIKVYLFLYCLSPFLNKIIVLFSKKDFQKLIIVLFVLFSIIPFLTGLKNFGNTGFTLYHFTFMYLIGAYLRKYPLNKSYIFKIVSDNFFRLILIFIVAFCWILNVLLLKSAESLLYINSILDKICNNLLYSVPLYSNPIIIIQAIAFFSILQTMSFKSKIINLLSKCTLGVYLIHENRFVIPQIYVLTKVNNGPIFSYSYILYVIIMGLIIYFCCSFIEFLRKCLFKLVTNCKIYQKIREKYYNWIRGISLVK